MITRSLKGKVLALIVFLIGIGTCIIITNLYDTRVAGNQADTRDRVTRSRRDVNSVLDFLGLDGAQREQVNKILEETRSEFRELQKQTQPQFQALRETSQNKIRAVLNDEQRAKYDEFIQSQEERRRRRRE
jgi:hypothetical protein